MLAPPTVRDLHRGECPPCYSADCPHPATFRFEAGGMGTPHCDECIAIFLGMEQPDEPTRIRIGEDAHYA